jgi:uncharacterized protein involved in outer membrane biogenesis
MQTMPVVRHGRGGNNRDMTSDMPPTGPAGSSASPAPERRKGGPLRVLKWVVIVVVLLIVIGLVALYLSLNSIVRSTVQKQSTAQLNVPTELDAARVNLFGGDVTLKGFDVGSPQGFKAPQMMSLGAVDVGVKLSELRQEPLRVDQITITDPKLVIEMDGTKFNVKQFIDNLPAGEPPKPADQKQPMKLIINDLKVQGAQVVFRPDLQAISALPGIGQSLSGLKQEYTLNIPTLQMQNVGTGEGNQNGAAIKDVVSLLVTQLASKAAQSNDLPPELRQVLSLNVGDLTNMLKAKLGEAAQQQLGKITEDLSKNLPPEAANAIKEKLGGILGGVTGTTQPSSPTTGPSHDATKALEQGLGNLLGGKKK